MLRLAVLVVFVALWTGCTPVHQAIMVNLRTGDVKQCGGIGKGLGEESYDKCVAKLREVGYKPSEELTPEEKANLPKKQRVKN